jgi:hypothetical protein
VTASVGTIVVCDHVLALSEKNDSPKKEPDRLGRQSTFLSAVVDGTGGLGIAEKEKGKRKKKKEKKAVSCRYYTLQHT